VKDRFARRRMALPSVSSAALSMDLDFCGGYAIPQFYLGSEAKPMQEQPAGDRREEAGTIP